MCVARNAINPPHPRPLPPEDRGEECGAVCMREQRNAIYFPSPLTPDPSPRSTRAREDGGRQLPACYTARQAFLVSSPSKENVHAAPPARVAKGDATPATYSGGYVVPDPPWSEGGEPMRRCLPVLAVLAGAPGRRRPRPAPTACLIPAEKPLPAAGDAQPQGEHHHRGPGRRHQGRADLPQPHRPQPGSHLHLPRPQGRLASTSSPCGSTARKSRASWSRRTRPGRSTPTSSAAPRTPACSSTSATTCCR